MSMREGDEERRMDRGDGKAYTKAQFVEHYKSLDEWEKAEGEKRTAGDGSVYSWGEFVEHYGKGQGPEEWARAGARDRKVVVQGGGVEELREQVMGQVAALKEENKSLRAAHRKLEAEHAGRIGDLEREVKGLRGCLEAGCAVWLHECKGGVKAKESLHSACREGALEVVRHLFASHDAAEWVDSIDRDGETPAHVASKNKHTEVVKALAAEGADLGKRDKGGESVLMAVYRGGGHSDLVKEFAEQAGEAARADVLVAAGRDGDIGVGGDLLKGSKTLRELMGGKKKEDVDKAVGRTGGRTYLWLAACFGSLEAVRGLLEAGADPLVRAEDGTTARDVAVRHGHLPVAGELLKAEGANRDLLLRSLREEAGRGLRTALGVALDRGYPPDVASAVRGESTFHFVPGHFAAWNKRASPSTFSAAIGTYSRGSSIQVVGFSPDRQWLEVLGGGWVLQSQEDGGWRSLHGCLKR